MGVGGGGKCSTSWVCAVYLFDNHIIFKGDNLSRLNCDAEKSILTQKWSSYRHTLAKEKVQDYRSQKLDNMKHQPS